MDQDKIITSREIRNQERLVSGLATADCYISRTYLNNLSNNPVVAIDESLCQDSRLRFFHIGKFVYDKKENVNDKLISVFSALHEMDSNVLLLIQGYSDSISFYMGIFSGTVNAASCGQILEGGLTGNFPGSSMNGLKATEIRELMNNAIGCSDHPKNVSAVSLVPSMRDKDKDKFIQGIEKFINTMQGEDYSALFIAKPFSKEDLEYRKRGLEELASSLSPFIKTTFAYGENFSKAVTDGMCENLSRSINQSIANTTGHNVSSNTSVTDGKNSGLNLFGYSTGTSKSKTSGFSSGRNWSQSVTEGIADTVGTSKNSSNTETIGDSRTTTVEFINKSIENLNKTIDMQLERIRDCESFGVWDCAAYFLSDKIHVAVMAANTYKALVSGDSSSVENSYINTWDSHDGHREEILKYLRYGQHPQILISEGVRSGFDYQVVTPGSYVSGKELPLFMGTPHKSVSGLIVSTIAEFGRGVFTLDSEKEIKALPLGHVFHMGQKENLEVALDLNSFTSHCFISGSTGSGKSNTVYVLLEEFYRNNIPFLVVEPAKGEYKTEFGALPGVHVFSTNPRYGQMLRLNPFWFDAEQTHVLEHLDRLVEIFNACWEMYAAMPAILKAGAERIYAEKGWDILNSVYLKDGTPQYPTFNDLLRVLPEIIKTSAYSADTQGDYTGALMTRVASLANGIFGQIFCSNTTVSETVLFDENTIVDLSRVGSAETKSLIMGILVMKLTEYRMAQATGSNRELRHITVLEEAHNLLKRTSSAQGQETANLLGKSVEMISNSIAEMRTFGEGFIIVDQSPTAVDISAIKNTNTKIIMRMPEKADCEAVGNAMALNEDQVKELAKLPTGVGAVIQNNWLEAVLVKVNRSSDCFQGDIRPLGNGALQTLRGAAVTEIIRQYFTDRHFDSSKAEAVIQSTPAPDDKKREILEQVLSLVDALESERNTELVANALMEISCCRGIFDAHMQMLNRINFANPSDYDLQQLVAWKDNIVTGSAKIVSLSPEYRDFLVRTLICSIAFSGNSENLYSRTYKLLYECEDMATAHREVAAEIAAETTESNVR